MRCDYFIQKELVFEYQAKNGKIYTIYTGRTIQKGFIFNYPEEDSDDDIITANKKFKAELERKIKENTYDKILFKNGKWLEESYKKKYEKSINETCKDILQLIKVYKKLTAHEKM
jgi:hypothetical protein